jgi:phage RecT family recombinase
MSDSQVASTNKNPVQSFIKNPSIQKTIEDRLKGRAGQFTTSLLSVINNNALLAECRPDMVLQAAMTAASMDLPLNQNLGFAYMIPYKNKGVYEAQFQMGWKGFVQLAQRSGLYKTIAATPVYEGQLITNDPLRGIAFDWTVPASGQPIGYAAYFELLNGFEKTLYMTMAEVTAHAKQYSQSYKSGFGPWKDNFEAMAEKTVLKLCSRSSVRCLPSCSRLLLATRALAARKAIISTTIIWRGSRLAKMSRLRLSLPIKITPLKVKSFRPRTSQRNDNRPRRRAGQP